MKICVITATRAEYGLLKPLLVKINSSERLELQILVTGAHLSPEFGLTYRSIEAEGFTIDDSVEILLSSDTPTGVVKTMGVAMIGLADVFSRQKPDVLVILGDRYEMLAVASAATIFRIPIAHIHGGEITEGAYDDAIRHAITKLSTLHFTTAEEYRNRVIQLGEQPDRVFNVGAIGLDNIRDITLLDRKTLEQSLGINFNKYTYQVTFHPETLGNLSSQEQFQRLLDAIDVQTDSFFIFTKANADTDGRIINQMIDEYVNAKPEKSIAFHTLGSLRFLSTLAACTAIVGNSSSGILEAPSLHTATINIGGRQKGRLQALSVVNVDCTTDDIIAGFERVKSDTFRRGLDSVKNPYDNGGAADKIVWHLEHFDGSDNTKRFYDLI